MNCGEYYSGFARACGSLISIGMTRISQHDWLLVFEGVLPNEPYQQRSFSPPKKPFPKDCCPNPTDASNSASIVLQDTLAFYAEVRWRPRLPALKWPQMGQVEVTVKYLATKGGEDVGSPNEHLFIRRLDSLLALGLDGILRITRSAKLILKDKIESA